MGMKRCSCPSHGKIIAGKVDLKGTPNYLCRVASKSVPKWVARDLSLEPGRGGAFVCKACISYARSEREAQKPVKQPEMEECYLNVWVEQPKPPRTGTDGIHSYAEHRDVDVDWEPGVEASSDLSPPPSPPPSSPPPPSPPSSPPPSPPASDDASGEGRGVHLHVLSLNERDRDVRVVSNTSGRGGARPRAGRKPARSTSSSANLMPTQPPLQLPAGRLTEYLVDIRSKQQQIQQLQANYNSLVEKVHFRNAHPDWSDKVPEPAPDAPLVTLRDGRSEREPPVVPIESLSDDTLLPLTPTDAWEAVAALRLQVLELQVALMYSRIQVKYRELRLQEVTAEHRRFKASVREQKRRAEKEEQSREMRIRQLERRCDAASTNCSEWRLKTREAEKTGNKKKRRSEMLTKGLEEIFTPMQLRVIRTGKKPRWTEEDIKRAMELKKLVTRRGYTFIRSKMKIPLPSPRMMREGALRFETLKPLYEQMVAANLLKYSTKKTPKTKKESRSVDEQDLEIDTRAAREQPPAVEAAAETARRAPVKRRKKRPPPSSFDVEFEGLSAMERAFATGSVAAAPKPKPKRGRIGLAETRPSWDCSRIWDGRDQPADEYEQRGEGRRPRHRPAWSADTADFI